MTNEEGWRVGVLFSTSGVTAAVEQTMLNATLLAIEEINRVGGVAGKPLIASHRDPNCSPKRYRELARQCLQDDGISTIFGCFMSSCRKAVLPEIEAFRGLLFYPTVYEGFEYSPRCFYTGASSNQGAIQLARYLMANYGNRFLLVGSNYVFPYEYNRVITDIVTQSGGKILDELYVPISAIDADFDSVIKKIQKLQPDAIISTIVGQTVGMFYEKYALAGFEPSRMPIAAITTSEAEIALMAPKAAIGHITTSPFFETLDRPEARRFVQSYKAKFGKDAPVTACAEAAYFQVYLYAKALGIAGSNHPDSIIKAMGGLEFEAPQGRVKIDGNNHHTELWPRIGRVDANGKFGVIWESTERVKPDPYFVSASYDDWSAASNAALTG